MDMPRITLSQSFAECFTRVNRSLSRSGLFFFNQAAMAVEKKNWIEI